MAQTEKRVRAAARRVAQSDGKLSATEAAKKNGAKAASKKPGPSPNGYTASVFSWPSPLPDDFVGKLSELEQALGLDSIWMLCTDGLINFWSRIDDDILEGFIKQKDSLPQPEIVGDKKKSKLGLLIDSRGGIGRAAYRIGTLLQRRCGGFTAIVPRIAKSAATLLSCGADSIVLGEDAELGPLDAQFFDSDEAEGFVPALDEVQAVEALEQSATDTAYAVMMFLRSRTYKRLNTLMPHAMHFAAEITKPLFEKIDAVRYSKLSRMLQEAQDYAERLLRPRFAEEAAKAIAKELVRNYPTHEFVIDRAEARRIGKIENRGTVGLPIQKTNQKVDALLDWFQNHLSGVQPIQAIGKLTARQP